MNQKEIISKIEEALLLRFGCGMDSASPQQIYKALFHFILPVFKTFITYIVTYLSIPHR